MSALLYVQNASATLPTSIDRRHKIYKDECMYSFDTPENNINGIDVCLSCFQAFARTSHMDWTAQHYNRKAHLLYLNINKELKPESERPSPFQLDLTEDGRLPKAPKLEILQQTDLDLYNTSTKVYIAELDSYVALKDSPEVLRLLVDQILAANSANTDNDIKAWEHEVFPCEHSQSLSQASENNNVDTSKCSLCDLSLNLWICLTCGTVSCGRSQFGSDIKGNSHALAHYDHCGHPVAAKLGSLSAEEDKCDCYCYKCNDEVKVPGLASTLKSFGIDISTATKSEKSLIELNLETNKTWQFNLDGTDGELLSPVFGPGLTGMKNLGNSCYMNSVLQALFSVPAYRDFFADRTFDEGIANPAEDLPSQLLKLHDGLISGRYSRPSGLKGDLYQEGIKPNAFKNLIGEGHEEFRTNKQQDANEFLLYLLDKIDKEFGLTVNRDFKFVTSSKLVCTNCHSGSMSHELTDTVSVPLKMNAISVDENGKKTYEPTSFEEGFDTFTKPEIIEDYQCDVCGQKTIAQKQVGFRTYPKYLFTSLQRIQLENWAPVKVEVPVDIPYEVNLSSYRSPGFEDGEKEIANVEASKQFVPEAEAMLTLQSMGFSENRSTRALYHTGNRGAEEAMNWIFAHMEDTDIDSPFTVPSSSENSSAEIPQESIDNLVAMGFNAHLARKALHIYGGDSNGAVDWLFNNPDDDGVIHDKKTKIDIKTETENLQKELLEQPPTNATSYRIKAVVCHKGTSPHTGHYVVFVRENSRWILFNDEKVVECGDQVDEIRRCGYMYLFERT